jgi:gluconolactonase
MTLRTPLGRRDSGGDGMAIDSQGRAWITSLVGIQVFDVAGRLGGVLALPQAKPTVSCAFAGSDHSWLYVCSSDRVFRRKVLR